MLEKWEMDGYLVGKIQYIDDENMREEEAEIFRRQVQETRYEDNSPPTPYPALCVRVC